MSYEKIAFCLLLMFYHINSQATEWMAFSGGTCVYGFLCKEDTVWIHTTGGIAKLNTVTNKMEFYNTGNSELKSNLVRALALDSTGSLWAGTNWGVSKYDGAKWIKYTTANSNISPYYQNSLAVDENNNVWAGTWGISHISFFNGTSWNSYSIASPVMPQNSIEAILTNWRGKTLVGWSGDIINAGKDNIIDTIFGIFGVTDMVRDSINNIWISTQTKGVLYFDGNTADTINSGLPSNGIYGLCYDNLKRLYAITRNNLLHNENGNWVNCVSISDISPYSDAFTSLAADNKGNLWLGTAYSYCYKWDGNLIKQYYPFNCAHPLNPLSIGVDSKGRCWAGNWSGYGLKDTMIFFDGSAWHRLGGQHAFTALDSLCFKKICDMDTLKIWVDSNCALVYWKNNRTGNPYFEWCCYTIGDKYGHGSQVKRDRKGTYWFAAPYGLWRFDKNGSRVFTKNNSSIPGESVAVIAIDYCDKLWLDVKNKYINGDTSWLVTLQDTCFTTIRTAEQYYLISNIEIDFEGNIWFSENCSHTFGIEFGHGIFKLSGSNITNYTISNSPLSSNTVTDLSLNKNNTLWISTYAVGIDTLSLNDSTWGYFTVENSHIANSHITQIEFDANDNKWFNCHMEGITIYRKGGIDFQTSIEPLPHNKTNLKKTAPFYCNGSKLYFKTPIPICAKISVYSVSGRKIAFFEKREYAPGLHCLRLGKDTISQSVIIIQIESEKEKYWFRIFNVNH